MGARARRWQQQRGMLLAVLRRRTVEMFAERPRQGRAGIEAAFKGDFRQCEAALVHQFNRAQQAAALQKRKHRLARQRAKDTVKVKG